MKHTICILKIILIYLLGEIEIFESTCNQFGFSSSLYAKCNGCDMSEFLACGQHPSNDENPRTLQGKDVNRRVVLAAFESGIGKEGVAKFCEILNMPFNMSPNTWYNHEEVLSQAHLQVTRGQLQTNNAEARNLAMLDEGIPVDNEDTIVDVPVSFDGTWSKRGYTANHCIGFVISAATGKVLDFEVISKVCLQCTQMKAKLDDDSFNDWYQDHICEGSYKGSSPSMEMECAKRLWGRSENCNVRYKWMICDGDSKSYNAIWNVYGACDSCYKYEAKEQTDKEFIAWKNSADYKTWEESHLQGTADCNRVIKLDCIGHV